jgi:hypothetical protein
MACDFTQDTPAPFSVCTATPQFNNEKALTDVGADFRQTQSFCVYAGYVQYSQFALLLLNLLILGKHSVFLRLRRIYIPAEFSLFTASP